jgi:PAS domain S-box-containing protein
MLGMEIAHKRRPRLPAGVAQFLLGVAALAVTTVVCFRLEIGLARTGFAYVIVVALVSLLGSFSASMVLSVVAAASLNYFFAPPLFDLRIDVPEDIERIAAFLTTSLVVSALMTKLKRAEGELGESNARSEAAQRLAQVGWWERDLITGHVTVSDAVCRILGERPVARWLHLIHPEDRAKAAGAAAAAARPGGPRYDVEYRVIRPDGTLRVVHSQGDMTWDDSGRPLRQFGVLQDVTELRQAEQELRASEARFRTFVDHAMDGFFLFDAHQAILDVNRKACESLSYSREEMIGMHPRDFDAGLDEASVARIGERVTAGETVTFETLHRRKDGKVFPVEVRARQFLQGAHRFRLSLARDITERKRAEDVLRESEAKLQKAQRIAHFGWWERDFATNHVSLSDEVCRIFGLQPVDLPEWHGRWLNLIHPEDRPRVADAAAAALRRGGPRYEVEYRVVRPDCTEGIVHSQGDVTWDESGRPLRQFGVLQDITELRQAEHELRASEARFRTFVDYATDAFFLLDDDSTVLDVNRRACESLGYSRDELIGRHRRDLDIGLDEASIAQIRQRIAGDETVTFETRHRRKDGTSFPVEVRAGQFEQGGRRFLCLARDITERKRAEDELRESEERFRTLVQFSFDVYWESDPQHRFTRQEFAEGLADAPGAGSEIGKTRWEVPHVEPDAEGWRKHRETLDAHLPFRDFELARPTPDGGKRYVSVSGLPVFDKSGHFIGYRGVGRHITERKRVEEALRRSESYLAEAQRLSHTGTTVLDARAPVYLSEESYRIWGLDPRQGLPSRETLLQRVHPDDRERVDSETQAALAEKRDYVLEFRIIPPDGRVRHLEASGHPLLSADGNIELLGTHVDVTDRKRAQEEHERLRQLEADLAHVNRLSIMGELAASLAHEILHPIATARNNARAGMRFLEMRPPNLDEVREALSCVVRDADRAKGIVDRMREHIKKAPPRNEAIDVNEAINEVIVMVQSAIAKNRVSVHTRLAEGLISVQGDRVQLQQVVVNLVLNAVEAMGTVEEGARELTIRTEQCQTGGIRVAVCDSGPGIDPQRVFEPFYTTKASGVGMGLSICRSIIDSHAGRLWVEANEPRGTIFQFTLPAAQDES